MKLGFLLAGDAYRISRCQLMRHRIVHRPAE